MTKLEINGLSMRQQRCASRARKLACAAGLLLLAASAARADSARADDTPQSRHSVFVTGAQGEQIRVTAYGKNVVRIQSIRAGEMDFPQFSRQIPTSR